MTERKTDMKIPEIDKYKNLSSTFATEHMEAIAIDLLVSSLVSVFSWTFYFWLYSLMHS